MCVLKQLCEGKTSQQIADELFVSKRTIEFHVRSIYNRLNVSNRVQALRAAQTLGLLAPT
jgi:DNA-binding NarL/FixJ family response regulator